MVGYTPREGKYRLNRCGGGPSVLDGTREFDVTSWAKENAQLKIGDNMQRPGPAVA